MMRNILGDMGDAQIKLDNKLLRICHVIYWLIRIKNNI